MQAHQTRRDLAIFPGARERNRRDRAAAAVAQSSGGLNFGEALEIANSFGADNRITALLGDDGTARLADGAGVSGGWCHCESTK